MRIPPKSPQRVEVINVATFFWPMFGAIVAAGILGALLSVGAVSTVAALD